jgi:hypothetical protein
MRVGVATDHGGFALKQEFVAHLRAAGHELVDFGAHRLDPTDDYPDFVVSLAQAVAAGRVERGVAIWPAVLAHPYVPTRFPESEPHSFTTTIPPSKGSRTII